MSFNAKNSLRVMKLTAIMLTVFAVHVMAGTEAQTISFRAENVPLKQVFTAIKKQTGYLVVYNAKQVEASSPVTINAKDEPLNQFLNSVLKGRGLEYTIENKTIIISQKKEVPLVTEGLNPRLDIAPPPANIDVTITVIAAEDNQPLKGASITIKGQNKGIATDINGRATLRGIDPNATLVISFTGYQNQEIKIANRSSIVVRLAVSTSELDEIQIIAYGQTSQRLNTGNISTVKAKDIEKQPVTNPLLALQGRAAGLFITQSNGLPGSGVQVLIQGRNSIQSGNDPFYVIDGVPYTPQMLPNWGSALLGQSGVSGNIQGGNPLNFINPSDIESVSVLKDAEATAIYGSRAANGAILITTKKGRAGQTKIDIDFTQGWGQVTRKLNLMNTSQYLEMRREGQKNDNVPVTSTDGNYDINGFWDTTRYTDWQKELIGGKAQYTNASASVSGGSANTQYLISSSYHRETTVFPGSFSDQKGSAHFTINSRSTNQRFNIQLSGNYLIDNSNLANGDLTGISVRLAPDAPALYNSDGSINWALTSSGGSSWTNPVAALSNRYKNITSNLVANAVVGYRIAKGLELKANLGYNNLQSNEVMTLPLISTAPNVRQFVSRTGFYSNNNINSWIIEPQGEYKTTIGNGRFIALLGGTLQQNRNNGQQMTGAGYNSDAVIEDIASAASVSINSAVRSLYKYNAFFGRLNYDLKDRYLFSLTARRDGSSRFGANNPFHNFGAAGVGWIFSEEPFIKLGLPFLSFGKLKVSYGTTGNDQIGDYGYLNLYVPISVGVTYQDAIGLTPNKVSNPYLEWEETKKLQAGIDLAMFKDRLTLNVNYYHNRSSNELLSYRLSVVTGFANVLRNFPATVLNTGLEFTVASKNIHSENFQWSTNFNLTIPKNKLVDFPNLANSSYANSLVVGEPITVQKMFSFAGVNPTTGAYQFYDSKGAIVVTPNGLTDRIVLVNTAPKFYGGFQNSFEYKGFELDLFFQFVKQTVPNNLLGLSVAGSFNLNQPVNLSERWKQPGDVSQIQRFNSNYSLGSAYFNAAINSDAGFSDGSYIRLKNLSISYQIPQKLSKKTGILNAKLFVLGQNLLTITHYKGLDPENYTINMLPPLKVITFGTRLAL